MSAARSTQHGCAAACALVPLADIAETAAALGQDDLAEQISEWAGEVERLQKNDARYRWLRGNWFPAPDDLEAAIDAELAKGA